MALIEFDVQWWSRFQKSFFFYHQVMNNLSLCRLLSDHQPTSPNYEVICHPNIDNDCTTHVTILWLTLWFYGVCWSVSCGKVRFIRECNLEASGSTLSTRQAQAQSTWCREDSLRPAITLSLSLAGLKFTAFSFFFCESLESSLQGWGTPWALRVICVWRRDYNNTLNKIKSQKENCDFLFNKRENKCNK